MYTAADLRKGLKIEIDGVPYIITEYNFLKPGKGQAIYNCKLKNLLTGGTVSKSYRAADKIDQPELHEKTMHFSYADGTGYVFLDENYEQITLGEDVLGDQRLFLEEDIQVDVLFHNGRVIEVTLPNFVEKEVVQTDPGARGNTATNVLKPATVKGGYIVQVPLFINTGDVLKIDTRTGKYVDRVKKS